MLKILLPYKALIVQWIILEGHSSRGGSETKLVSESFQRHSTLLS